MFGAAAGALREQVTAAKKRKNNGRLDGHPDHGKTRQKRKRAARQRRRSDSLTTRPPSVGPPPEVAPPPNPDPDCIEHIAPVYYQIDVPSLIRTRTARQVAAKRAELIEFIWKGAGFPTRGDVSVTQDVESPISPVPGGTAAIDAVDVPLGDRTSHAVHFHAEAPSGRLMLYHAGHSHGLGEAGGERTIRYLLDRGDDVLAFWMPGLGPNLPHDSHNLLAARESASFTPLTLFLEPPLVALNHLLGERSYDDVGMIGVSGGGWTTTWIAAVDPRVRLSVPVAGSLPLFLHGPPCGEGADWEQVGSAVYGIVDYTELYVLAGAGAGRTQVQVINKYDPCCFRGVRFLTYADIVHDIVAGLDGGAWHAIFDTTHREHAISEWALGQVLR